jgi:hypothetical protein
LLKVSRDPANLDDRIMMRLGKALLFVVACAGLFYGGALLSVRLSNDATPQTGTDASTQVPPDRASGPPPGYEPPAPADTPCLQPAYVSRCIGRATARTGLMTLAGLQEARRRDRRSYAEDADDLGFRPANGMELRMRADSGGWTAEYHHIVSGVGCATYAGDVEGPFTTSGGTLPESPGAVACDDPLATGR